MWRMLRKELQPRRIEQYQIVGADGSIMTYAQVVDCWRSDPGFTGFFCDQLASSPFKAFLWETPPLTRATFDRPFEFVLVDNAVLARVEPDVSAFSEHFDAGSDQGFVRFDNLGGDARLVSPCPLEPVTACAHLAVFLREAPAAAVIQLWREVAAAISESLNDQPVWVSTCGLGVYWLHVRLDSFPKYYHYAPYQSAD
jgi:hypothetical protein